LELQSMPEGENDITKVQAPDIDQGPAIGRIQMDDPER